MSLTLNVPTTVTRFSLTEGGNMHDGCHHNPCKGPSCDFRSWRLTFNLLIMNSTLAVISLVLAVAFVAGSTISKALEASVS